MTTKRQIQEMLEKLILEKSTEGSGWIGQRPQSVPVFIEGVEIREADGIDLALEVSNEGDDFVQLYEISITPRG